MGEIGDAASEGFNTRNPNQKNLIVTFMLTIQRFRSMTTQQRILIGNRGNAMTSNQCTVASTQYIAA